MKLPFKRDTSTALQRARDQLAARERAAAELEQRRQNAVLEADGYEPIAALDRELAAVNAELRFLRERVSGLEAVQLEEQRQVRQRKYEAAVDRVAAMLPRRAKAAADLEAAAKAVGDALQKLHTTEQTILREWPANLPRPWLSSMDFGRAERVLANGFGVFAAVNRRWGWSFSEKVQRLGAELAGFAAGEAQHHDELIADLRAQPAPEPDDALSEIAA